MADRKIYLCRICIGKRMPRDPFFNCGHHFDKLKETFEKKRKGDTVEKITGVDNEACEHCLGDWYADQLKNSRLRAVVFMNSLLAESVEQTKDDSL